MCELLGFCSEQPLSAKFSIREFADRDKQNPDGWGLGWYPDQSAALIKEPIPWRSSRHSGFLESYHATRSRIFLGHVRHKTVGGEPTHADTHPFLREWAAREYLFAHNGTLKNLEADLRLGLFMPLGATDSEYAFCHLLQQIATRGSHLESSESFTWLARKLRSLNQYGELNCVMSDGHTLFCYHDSNGYKGLVWRAITVRTDRQRHFADQELEIAFQGGNEIGAFIVATEPLGESGWASFNPGELMVIRHGSLIYSSHRKLENVSECA